MIAYRIVCHMRAPEALVLHRAGVILEAHERLAEPGLRQQDLEEAVVDEIRDRIEDDRARARAPPAEQQEAERALGEVLVLRDGGVPAARRSCADSIARRLARYLSYRREPCLHVIQRGVGRLRPGEIRIHVRPDDVRHFRVARRHRPRLRGVDDGQRLGEPRDWPSAPRDPCTPAEHRRCDARIACCLDTSGDDR